MAEARKKAIHQTEKYNESILIWVDKREEIYIKAEISLDDAIKYADSLIKHDLTLDKFEISELHIIVGELLYESDSIQLALDRFNVGASITFDSPRKLGNKAACYTKLGNFDTAKIIIEKAIETNGDYKWYLGNLYEILGQPQKAVSEYLRLYNEHKEVYKYCKERADFILTYPDSLLTEISLFDTRTTQEIMFGQ